MIGKETWKKGKDRDEMEKLIKYHMHVQYHNKLFLKKKKFSQMNVK